MNIKTRKVDVEIKHDDGTIVFEKAGFEVPEAWSDRAATIVASKYAMDNEFSAVDIINRVVNQITDWGIEQQYFNDANGDDIDFSEALTDILINQRASFNSPVWFNCGSDTGTNQMSGCFILPVEDTMESILEHYKTEGTIFCGGSGAGINVSKLRAKGEKLSNKGESSGPLSFMRGWDSNAGTIKSGGKVRRAAKMVCMDVDHPDIMDFIDCKKLEEDKAKYIIKAKTEEEIPKGMSEKKFRKTPEFAAIAAEAYSTVAFQNTNHSIRVTNDFMDAVSNGRTWKLIERKDRTRTTEVMASDVLRRAAEIAWHTGDPGIQYDDEMNRANPIPNTDRINSTNPCSEFSAVDNSSCNLASLNLLKYLDEDDSKTFNIEQFETDIEFIITAMDILVDAADYPIEAVGEMTRKTRPLGLGFANLGAYLMVRGLPYDSEEARKEAADITRLMTTVAYRRSTELAERLGSFAEFEKNKEECIEVAKKLTFAHHDNWSEGTEKRIRKHGLRNSQLTLLAPTGTISFIMDCDTSGIEPLFALKTIKTLAGGGTMEIDYPSVERATEIHTDEDGKIDSAILQTANEIPWKGHIDMMAACQKHLNGAISKTVNMSQDATVDDIEKAYMYAWKAKLKCIAVYRDGCKELQPMMAASDSTEEDDVVEDNLDGWSALRRKLPETRNSVTHKFNVGGLEGYLTVGMYEDGNPGEIFIRTQKQGSTMQGVLDAFATAVSLALQYGVPVKTMIDKFIGSKFEPAGWTPNEEIKFTSSVMDYIFRWLAMNFLDEEDESLYETEVPVTDSIIPPSPAQAKYDGPPCGNCGSVTSRSGTCYICTQCGETTGCS